MRYYEDNINSVTECKDGEYIVGGCFHSSSIDLGNGISLTKIDSTYDRYDDYSDGMVIKYEDLVKKSSVLVHYYLKDTTTSLSDDVTIAGRVGDAYTASPATDIPEYYELVATPSNQAGTMTEDQIVVTYYYQLKSYPYTVNYLEKDTGTVLHAPKTGTGFYGSTVSSANEKISIDGYNFNSVDKDSLTIGTSGNVINLYYTKRTDLSYTVNYLEKDTNKVIHTQKVKRGMTFGTTVNATDEKIAIDGYNYASVDKSSITIGTGSNVLNFYYTKRADLSYTVNYFEKGTTTAIKTAKVKSGMTFQATVTSASEKIDIDGYNYDSASAASITIGTGSNVLNLYYTKRTDLSYTVNYLEKGSNAKLKTSKTVSNITFGSTVKAAKEKVAIDGYNYDSVSADTITIGTGSNVINFYYTKRTDLTYTINYLEKDTNTVIKTG